MSIRLSQKYGVNPAIPVCFFCGEEKNEILLPGRMKDDMEAPRHAVWDKRPCEKCEGFMKMGVILVSVKEGTDHENPYRTGGFVVIKAEAAERIFATLDASKDRFAFVEDKVWDDLGLPREKTKGGR